MFVTRFWFFLLSAAVGLVLAVMYLLQDSMNDGLRKNVDDLVQADFAQVQSSLKLQARGHLDKLSEITANEPLRLALLPLAEVSLLNPAAATPAPAAAPAPAAPGAPAAAPSAAPPTEEQLRRLTGTLRGVLGDLLKSKFPDLRRPFLLALNRRGEVVGHEGTFPPPEVQGQEFGLYGFPSVRAVLRGYERDDIWLVRIKGKAFMYQIAGRPVVHQGKYLGAVLLGRPIDDEFAMEIREEAGLSAQLFFFAGDTVVAKSVRPPAAAGKDAKDVTPTPELDPQLIVATVTREAKDWLTYARQPTRPLVNVGEGYRGMFAPLRGEAARAGAGYLVLRPVVAVASPWTVLKSASKQGLSKVPVFAIAGICLGAFILAMLWIFLERDRPLLFFRKQAVILKGKENERFNAYLFRGKYRQIAVDINAAIDKTVKAVAAGARASGPDVASILGPASSGLKLGSQPIAGFDDEEAAAKAQEPQAAPSQVDLGILGGAVPSPLPPAPPPPPPMASAPAPLPAAPPPPPPFAGGPAAIPPPAVLLRQLSPSPAAPPAAPRPPLPGMSEPQPLDENDLDEPLEGEGYEGPTRVVSLTDDLMMAAQGKVDPSEQREAMLRKLFNDFRSTKVQCGESVDGLTFDKFKASVDKSRSAIQSKQKCKDVQFSVYVKAGKAALKATPIV
jgi:hypothetical protein